MIGPEQAERTREPRPASAGLPASRRFARTFLRFGRPLLFVVPLLYIAAFLPRAGHMEPGDAARAYHQAGDAIREGRSMYEPLPPEGPHRVGNYYLYPPPLGALVGLLPATDPDVFQTLVLIANVIAVWIFAWVLARLARLPSLHGTLFVAALLLMMPGLPETIAIGNIDPIVFALVGLGIVLPATTAAASLTAGAALKVTPVWALGVLLARLRPSWPGAAAVAMACLLIVALATGVDGLIAESLLWARRIAPTLSQGQFEVLPMVAGGEVRSGWLLNGNISPAFLPVRLLVEQPPPGQDIPAWARMYLSIVQFGVPALTAWLTRHRSVREQAAWVISAATLAAPIMRGGYLPVLLLLPALLIGRKQEPPPASPVLDAS